MPDPIVVVPYDPKWPGLFMELGAALCEVLSETALRIDHIGSTAIPGLDAKPIIDVQISVASLEPLNAYRIPIESLGFVFRANNPDLSKRYFREKPGKRRTNVHVRRAGSWGEQGALLFRDYMRAHDKDARRYADLKHGLAARYRDDRSSYTNSKDTFIWEIMSRRTSGARRSAGIQAHVTHRQKRVAPQAYLSQIACKIILPVQADRINGMIPFKQKLAQKVGKLFSMM